MKTSIYRYFFAAFPFLGSAVLTTTMASTSAIAQNGINRQSPPAHNVSKLNPNEISTRIKMTLQVDGIDPQPPIDGGTLSVRFTLSNPTDTALVGDVLAVL